LKKFLITFLKIVVSVGILAYLVWNATRPQVDGQNVFANLLSQPKHWTMLAAALGFCFGGVLLTFIRWWYLVRALGLPFRFRDALRIGFLGYLFNLAPMGIIGGDLLKAVMLAHEHPQFRVKAVASVVIDRVIGLYMVFVVATVAILLTGFLEIPVPEIRVICYITFALTAAGALGIGILFIPGVTDGKFTKALERIPRVGHVIEDLVESVRMYRRQPGVLLAVVVMSAGVHCLFAVGVYLVARGLPGEVLSLPMHFVVIPLSASTGALPLPMGPYEFVLDFLYTRVSEGSIPAGQGLVVALGYRLICILIAMIGVCYYLGSRREVAEVMHEAEEDKMGERGNSV
jgi:uncharacterized protein (TIRG00374 family)